MKIRAFILLLFALCLPTLAHAQSSQAAIACPGINFPLQPMSFEQLTVSSTSIGFTASKITVAGTGLPISQQAIMAVVVTDGGSITPIRYRDDGVAPTSTIGSLLQSYTDGTATTVQPVTLVVCGRQAVLQWRAIRTASDATINVSYYAAAQ